MKRIIFIITVFSPVALFAQTLKPGFDKLEYQQLMYISAHTTADSAYYNQFPAPVGYQLAYQSQPSGLDNLWELWLAGDTTTAVISIRGTTEKSESWLANFYAAMVPAKGEITLNKQDVFKYELAVNPKAAVHVGWLLSMAYLEKEIIPKIRELHQAGVRNYIILGHSQGGAIACLLTAHLNSLQKNNILPAALRLKTYCSASPKPGNLYFAYEYEAMTQGGWSFNVVNAADWVPELPVSIQTLDDFNNVNPFLNAEAIIKKQKFPGNLVLKHIYKQLDGSTKKAQRKYEKYLGELTSQIIKKNLPGYEPPEYYSSTNYVRVGVTIVLLPDEAYFKDYPDDKSKIFPHHFHAPYLALISRLPEQLINYETGNLRYISSEAELQRAKNYLKKEPKTGVFVHSHIGLQAPDLKALNTELSANGFLPLDKIYFLRGGGLYTVFPQIKIATLFSYSTYSGKKTSGMLNNELRGTTIGSSIGFVAINNERIQLIPYAGGIYSWWGVRLSSDNVSGRPFSEYLASPQNQHHISTKGWTWNFGIHIATQPFRNKPLAKNLLVGVRAGYAEPFKRETKWYTNSHALQGGPAINTQGQYLQLLIGVKL
ncbi:hypothetical protein DC498_08100 [Terrimonas sp.]|uniref:lipase family protein n=1 Tax=Terrimonas sp. TaxID=1914338 RepID=UPI000D507D06|nr:lipase family protein [Terrimonas sp.]PVD52874.1 hypothetical protein DC498_08100 [Terrimonas sp.]